MLDAITLERRGIPAAAIGVDKLVMTTGRGMARIQGVPDFPIAVISHGTGTFTGTHDLEEFQAVARQAVLQVERILLLGRA